MKTQKGQLIKKDSARFPKTKKPDELPTQNPA